MPQGNFNVSRLLRRLGHKNQLEMPVLETIQATIPLASMAGQVPVHVGGVTIGGGNSSSAIAEYSGFQLHSLDPGGLVVQWIHNDANISFYMGLSDTATTWLSGAGICVPLNFTNNPSVSVLEFGNAASPVSSLAPQFKGQGLLVPSGDFAPLYVPRGSYLTMLSKSSNTSVRMSFCWCGIMATEAGE